MATTPDPAARYFDESEYQRLLMDDTLAGRCVFGILTAIVSMGLLLGIAAVVVFS